MILPPSEERTHQNGGTPPSSPYDNPRGTVTVESVDALHFLGGFQRIPSGRPRGFWGKAGPAGCGQGGRKINKKVRLFHRDCEKWYRHPRTTIHTHLPATLALDIIWHAKSNTAEDHMTRSVFFSFFFFWEITEFVFVDISGGWLYIIVDYGYWREEGWFRGSDLWALDFKR